MARSRTLPLIEGTTYIGKDGKLRQIASFFWRLNRKTGATDMILLYRDPNSNRATVRPCSLKQFRRWAKAVHLQPVRTPNAVWPRTEAVAFEQISKHVITR